LVKYFLCALKVMAGQRIVLRVPLALKEKIERAAEAQDKLPTEWLRDVARQAVEAQPDGGEGAA
jgi:hypothetical protein